MGGEKGKKKREFIVAAAINRVYGRTNEKSVCLDGGKKEKGKRKKENLRRKLAAFTGFRRAASSYSSFLFVSLTAGFTKFIEWRTTGKGGGKDRVEKVF